MLGRPRSVSNDEIFAAITNVIAKHGPGRLTVEAVAKQAGLSAPSVLQRFGTKQGLLVAYAAYESGLIAHEFRAARKGRTPLAALLNALTRLTRGISSHSALANNLAFLHLTVSDPDLRRHAIAQHRSLLTEIAALLADARAGGEINVPDIDVLADAIRAEYTGALTIWAIDGSGALAAWISDRVARVIAPYRTGHEALSASVLDDER